ncbi:MAG: tRNA (adenosine(37)-N6)-dimethylallyltransferase MiaA [Holosporales bacterium]|jgi:tRNA dimethylallyltransferase|nr:tRNA (adenosine(37)-N6)-dimethylallyltransferase MiaA [Holosporales bacterium]
MIFFSEKTIIPIGGTTASGKSAVAAELAVALEGEVVNADGLQLYKNLPILTAHPGEGMREIVKHHLYGVLECNEPSSAADWLDLLAVCLEDNNTANAFITTGGTGLFFSSLLYGLSSIPNISDSVRFQVRQQGKSIIAASGEPALYACVVKKDPLIAGRIHPHHIQHLLRAWEVIEQTGVSIFQWQKEPRRKVEYHRAPLFVIDCNRDELQDRIERRFKEMIEAGVFEEVRLLRDSTMGKFFPIHKAVGYQEIKRHLDGEWSLEETIEEVVKNTCQYAKRQQTWFRTQYQAGDIVLIPPDSPQGQASMILKKLCSLNS